MKKILQNRGFKILATGFMVAAMSVSMFSFSLAKGKKNPTVVPPSKATLSAATPMATAMVGTPAPEGAKPLEQALIDQSQANESNPNLDQPEGFKSPFLAAVLAGSYKGTGDQVEQDFLTFMIVHHQVAVEMAQLCVQRAVHPELIALCKEIGKSQAIQITQQNFYLAEHFQLYQAPAELEQDEFIIQELKGLQGAAFEKRWLELMPPHHSQAIVTAEVCAAGATHLDVKTLCQAISYVQQKQVYTMASWLKQWYGVTITTDPYKLASSIENASQPAQ